MTLQVEEHPGCRASCSLHSLQMSPGGLAWVASGGRCPGWKYVVTSSQLSPSARHTLAPRQEGLTSVAVHPGALLASLVGPTLELLSVSQV